MSPFSAAGGTNQGMQELRQRVSVDALEALEKSVLYEMKNMPVLNREAFMTIVERPEFQEVIDSYLEYKGAAVGAEAGPSTWSDSSVDTSHRGSTLNARNSFMDDMDDSVHSVLLESFQQKVPGEDDIDFVSLSTEFLQFYDQFQKGLASTNLDPSIPCFVTFGISGAGKVRTVASVSTTRCSAASSRFPPLLSVAHNTILRMVCRSQRQLPVFSVVFPQQSFTTPSWTVRGIRRSSVRSRASPLATQRRQRPSSPGSIRPAISTCVTCQDLPRRMHKRRSVSISSRNAS